MQLRSSNALKLFALILFTLEFLVPAMVTGLADTSQNKTLFVKASQFRNPLFSLFIEELCDNESKEFDRNQSSQNNLSLARTSQYLFQVEQNAPAAFTHSLLQFSTHPPLFRVHCKLLI